MLLHQSFFLIIILYLLLLLLYYLLFIITYTTIHILFFIRRSMVEIDDDNIIIIIMRCCQFNDHIASSHTWTPKCWLFCATQHQLEALETYLLILLHYFGKVRVTVPQFVNEKKNTYIFCAYLISSMYLWQFQAKKV